jgi:hypothetical protein
MSTCSVTFNSNMSCSDFLCNITTHFTSFLHWVLVYARQAFKRTSNLACLTAEDNQSQIVVNNSDKYVPQISLDEAAAGVAIAAVGRLVLPLTFVHDGLGHVLELEPGLACTGV